jgi:hypothetical protein
MAREYFSHTKNIHFEIHRYDFFCFIVLLLLFGCFLDGSFTVYFTHFRHFWAILPILVGKRIAYLYGFKKLITKMGKIH